MVQRVMVMFCYLGVLVMPKNKPLCVEVIFVNSKIPNNLSNLIEASDLGDSVKFFDELHKRGGSNDIPEVVRQKLGQNLTQEKCACDFYFVWEFEGITYRKLALLRPFIPKRGVQKTSFGEREKRSRFMQYRKFTINEGLTQEKAIGLIADECRKSESSVRDEIKQQQKEFEMGHEVSSLLIEIAKKTRSQDGN